jgi:hypothetical protein
VATISRFFDHVNAIRSATLHDPLARQMSVEILETLLDGFARRDALYVHDQMLTFIEGGIPGAHLMTTQSTFTPGDRVAHSDFGPGVVLEAPYDGFVRAFFSLGERRIPAHALRRERSRAERILGNVSADPARRAAAGGLAAHPAAAGERRRPYVSQDRLAAASVVQPIACHAAARRFLIADEVGLGRP